MSTVFFTADYADSFLRRIILIVYRSGSGYRQESNFASPRMGFLMMFCFRSDTDLRSEEDGSGHGWSVDISCIAERPLVEV